MQDRLVIIGNTAGGKSTLARAVAGHRGLKLTEVDRLLWQPGWKLTQPNTTNANTPKRWLKTHG